jgi:hypothetical protein
MDRNPTRSTRLEARLSPETLAVIKRAAEIEGRSVSDFVVAAAHQAAQRTIAETFPAVLMRPPCVKVRRRHVGRQKNTPRRFSSINLSAK